MAKMKKVSRLTKIRRLVQLIFIGAIGQWAYYGIFRCPFIVPFVNCQSCPIVTCWGRIATVFFGFWLFIPVLVIFLAFKLKLKNNKKLRYAQIGMVLAVLLSAGVYFIYGNPRVMIPIRTSDEYLNAVIMSFKFSDWYWAVRTAVVVALIAASLIVANLWCRFACPSGGIMELLRKISIFRVYKTDACDNCNACLRKCEMGTRPDEMNCTNCGDCMDVCHADAIKFGRKKD